MITLAHPTSCARDEPILARPPQPPPTRDCPSPSYFSVAHATVRRYIQDLDIVIPWNSPYLLRCIPCSATTFAVAAIYFFDRHTDQLHPFFWGPARRQYTAATVQRVLESAQDLAIVMEWSSAEHALSTLAAREQARASPPAVKRIVGAKSVESPQRLPRLTRAAAARQMQTQERLQQHDAQASTSALASPSAEKTSKRRQNPPLEAPAAARASARQQMQKERAEAVIPPAVVATVARPNHTRARSSSQESSETLVASSPTMSRAVSVSSADTAVDVVSASPAKGKGRLIADVPSESVDAPMSAELEKMAGTRMVTRSRTKTEPEAKPTPRKAPYPATMTAQVAAGRKAPTGKRKTAKAR
ncbi:hypothetical protein B0H16DRAFT_1496280 [Mycena metata]|uniref:Uncharacterized protein n=1 Tax=Mycena metata TaxID=1033252 RepID=A0AAD7P153_9AGAR|nr:hypothetical protein B0H16DRAFT_1496280 [Mycena metata]